MSILDAIYEVKHNPFKYAEYIASFYNSKVSEIENNVLLLPLVLPICTHSIYGKKRITSRSNLQSTFANHLIDFYDLKELIQFFKPLSKDSFYYCLSLNALNLDEQNMKVRYVQSKEVIFSEIQQAKNLGDKLFSQYSVNDIYSFFEVDCSEIFYS